MAVHTYHTIPPKTQANIFNRRERWERREKLRYRTL